MKIETYKGKKEYKIVIDQIRPCVSGIFSVSEKVLIYRLDRLSNIQVLSNTNDLSNPIFSVKLEFIDLTSLNAELGLEELGVVNSHLLSNKKKRPWAGKWNDLNSSFEKDLDSNSTILILERRKKEFFFNRSVLSLLLFLASLWIVYEVESEYKYSCLFIALILNLAFIKFFTSKTKKISNFLYSFEIKWIRRKLCS